MGIFFGFFSDVTQVYERHAIRFHNTLHEVLLLSCHVSAVIVCMKCLYKKDFFNQVSWFLLHCAAHQEKKPITETDFDICDNFWTQNSMVFKLKKWI